MKILIVEDDENNIALFESELTAASGCVATVARSRDAALAALKAHPFDLVVIDLRIPPQDGSLDADVNHGLVVHSFVQEHSHGTPIVIFSAYGTVRMAAKLTESCERHDVWGSGQEQQMTVFKEKTEFDECLAHISQIIDHIVVLSKIDFSSGGQALTITAEQKMILRVFARLHAGVNVILSPLGGGLSSAKTFRLEVQDQYGAIKSFAAAKLSSISEIEDELSRYQACIAPVFSLGGFAHVIRSIKAGAGNTGGLFYGFAREYQQTLLELLQADPGRATEAVALLKKMENDWHASAPLKTVTVGELRRDLIADSDFASHTHLLTFDWNRIESEQVRVRWCCQHRDLHALNVLVRDGNAPLLIDYGAVGLGPACLDPLILELSLLFHPACKDIRGVWPTADQALNWANLDEYLRGLPLEPFIRACRSWAFSVQPIDKGVYATAYAYAVRQLKFDDTDKALAVSVAKAASDRLTQA